MNPKGTQINLNRGRPPSILRLEKSTGIVPA